MQEKREEINEEENFYANKRTNRTKTIAPCREDSSWNQGWCNLVMTLI
jgi:hypothetical protein